MYIVLLMTSILEKLFGVVLLLSLLCFGLLIGGYIFPMYEDTTQKNIFSEPEYLNDRATVNSVDYTGESNMTIEEAQKGIVTVYAKKEGKEEVESQGSGFMYTNNHIMTNEHVVSGTSEFYIQYRNGEWSSAEFVGSDVDTDIAILKPETVPNDVPVLPMQMRLPSIGEPVVAIGSPSGLETTVTTGVVSSNKVLMTVATTFGIPDSIQTDAALNPGNSGGPLLSRSNDASVIGINRATLGENMGYAVSSRMAHEVGKSIIEKGNHQHGFVGVNTKSLQYKTDVSKNVGIDYGLIVSNVTEDGPSSNIGLRAESDNFTAPDILVKVDDKKLRTNEDLSSYIALNKEPGDEITFEIYRDGNVITRTIEVGNRYKYR
jgi:S1-C subfamily serine protease